MKKNAKGVMQINPEFLQKVHRIGFGWIFPKIAGRFRHIAVTVSQHKPPHFYEIPQMMKDFTEDLKMRLKHVPNLDHQNFLEELIGLLTWAHHRFLWIHPFVDYNGRIERLLINMVLLNLKLPPIELKVETKKGRTEYIKALQKADQGDYRSLKKLIRSAIEEAVKEIRG